MGKSGLQIACKECLENDECPNSHVDEMCSRIHEISDSLSSEIEVIARELANLRKTSLIKKEDKSAT